jgi:hypothetical protein
MKKIIVTCTHCHLPFLVEGRDGTLTEVSHLMNCPYPDCQSTNEVSWPMDGWCKAKPIYNQASHHHDGAPNYQHRTMDDSKKFSLPEGQAVRGRSRTSNSSHFKPGADSMQEPSREDMEAARNVMLKARQALEDYEKENGALTGSGYIELVRAFSNATDAYLRLIESNLR